MTYFEWMKDLPASFPMIYFEVWVGGGQWYWSVFWFLFPLWALTDVSITFPVAIYYRHVTLRYFLSMFISDKRFPSVPVAIRSFMIKKTLCFCGSSCAVVSSIDRLFSRIHFHVWVIQEWVIH